MRILNFLILILIATNTANGFDGSMMNGLQTLDYWQDYFHHRKGSILGLFNASMSLGPLCGLFLIPYMVDHYGRRIGVMVGSTIMILAVGLQTGAQNLGMFVAARLLLGFGDCIVLGSAPLLIAEISHPQDRAILVRLSASSYQSGAFIASWVTYGTLQIQSNWSWRLPSLLQGLCSITILVAIFFTPESPRWLVSKDRSEEALEMLAHWHADGNKNDEFVQLEHKEIVAAISIDQQAKRTGWTEFLKTKGNRTRIGIITAIAFFSQWSGNGIISYYLHTILENIGITSPKTQLGINGGITTWSLVTNIAFSFMVDRWGRRPTYMMSTVGTLVAFTIWTIIAAVYAYHPENSLGIAFVFMIYVYTLFYAVKSGLLASYTTEILPYALRAKGFVWLNFCVTAALFFNQYINAIALEAIEWKYYIVYCVSLVVEVFIIYFFIVETRYTPLEEIAKYFDGDEVTDVAMVANEQVKAEKVGLDLDTTKASGGASNVQEVEVA